MNDESERPLSSDAITVHYDETLKELELDCEPAAFRAVIDFVRERVGENTEVQFDEVVQIIVTGPPTPTLSPEPPPSFRETGFGSVAMTATGCAIPLAFLALCTIGFIRIIEWSIMFVRD